MKDVLRIHEGVGPTWVPHAFNFKKAEKNNSRHVCNIIRICTSVGREGGGGRNIAGIWM